MGVQVAIRIPGEKDAYVDIVDRVIRGELSPADVKTAAAEIDKKGSNMRVGSYSYLANFKEFLEGLLSQKKTKFTKYVIFVLIDAGGENVILNYDQAIIFYKGLQEFEEIFPEDLDKNFKRTFIVLKNLLENYFAAKNKRATIEFY